jgi:hypothetical protein
MENTQTKMLVKADPRPRRAGGIRGGSVKTLARRQQLKDDPGAWHVWKESSATGGDTGQALRTLTGITDMKGMDRAKLAYQATARRNEDGRWTVYVRYVGENQEFANA